MAESNFVDYVKINCRSGISATSSPSMVAMEDVTSATALMVRTSISMCLAVPWCIMPKPVSSSATWLTTVRKYCS